jgi:hypothetical protein
MGACAKASVLSVKARAAVRMFAKAFIDSSGGGYGRFVPLQLGAAVIRIDAIPRRKF